MKPLKSAGMILLVLILASSATVARPGVAGPFQEQQPGDDDLSPVQLDLVGANIYQVIQIIGDTLGLNYVIDQRVQGTVNINTSETLRRSDLLPILETILKINNASMVRTGNYYEILPAASAVRAPLEVRTGAVAESGDDGMVIQVIRLRFVSATEMSVLLGPYLGEGASVAVHAGGNVLMVTERESNLRKIMEVIQIFDAAVFENERVRMIPVRNARVADVVTDLQAVFSGYALSGDTQGAGGVRFVPLERLSSVLVIASVEDTFREVERWFERLDQPFANTGIRNYVYRVRNSKAADIQSVLSQLYGGALSIPVQSANFIPLNAPPGTEAAAPVQTPFGVVQPTGGQTTPDEDETRIIADTVTNSLIIHATPQEYEEILLTIEQLDLLPRQVLVDAQIYEVTLDDSLSFGVTAHPAEPPNIGRYGDHGVVCRFSAEPRRDDVHACWKNPATGGVPERGREPVTSPDRVGAFGTGERQHAGAVSGGRRNTHSHHLFDHSRAVGRNESVCADHSISRDGRSAERAAPDQRRWPGDAGDRTGNQPGRGQHDVRHRCARDRKIVSHVHDRGSGRTDHCPGRVYS